MRKWIGWVLAAVLVSLLVLGICGYSAIQSFFQTSGVHILGQYAHINLQEKCYIVSTSGADKDADVDAESTITISGLVLPLRDEDSLRPFTGFVNVEAYPMAFEDASRGTYGYVGEDYIYIRNQMLKLLDGDCERWYAVDILKSDPSIIVVQIFHKNGSVIMASGDTKEEAMQNYMRYLGIDR